MEKIEASNIAGDEIAAEIYGKHDGIIAAGKYFLEVMVKEGARASIAPPEQAPVVRARPTPPRPAPRPLAGLLDRAEEISHVAEDLLSRPPVEVYGREGYGKSTLLQMLAAHEVAGSFPDGVVSLEMRDTPPDELLKALYDTFYQTSIPTFPGEVAIRRALAGKKALVLVDEVNPERRESELRGLVDAAPGCAFLFASVEQRLWGEGCTHRLYGLPEDEARQLFERGFGKTPREAEALTIQAICAAVRGSPLQILQAASLAKENPGMLSAIAALMQEPGRAQTLAASLLSRLPAPEQRVLAALAALRGAPVDGRHLPKITGDLAAPGVLASLQARGMVQAHDSAKIAAPIAAKTTPQLALSETAYSLPGAVLEHITQQLAAQWNLDGQREDMLRYFTRWAQQQMARPLTLLEHAAPLQELLRWAAETARWKDVLHLAYLVEKALILGGRWTTWEEVLRLAHKAAIQSGDPAGQAWVLHQIGTRALCLGDTRTARAYLVRALRLRQQIGDRAGAEVTRHNLELLIPQPAARGEPVRSIAVPAPRQMPVRWLMGVLLALWGAGAITLAALAWNLGISPPGVIFPARSTTQADQASVIPFTGTGAPLPQVPGTGAATPTPAMQTQQSLPDATTQPGADVLPGAAPQPTTPGCAPRTGWRAYTIRPGDTLFLLAVQTGSSVGDIQQANCLAGSGITAGQSLLVPRLPAFQKTITPAPTTIATATSGATKVSLPTNTATEPVAYPPAENPPVPTATRLVHVTPSSTLPDLVLLDLAVNGTPRYAGQYDMDITLSATVKNTNEETVTDMPFNITIVYRTDPNKPPQGGAQPREGSGVGIVQAQVIGGSQYQQDIVLKNVDRAWLGNWMVIIAEVNRCIEFGAIPCPIPEANEQNNTAIFSIQIPNAIEVPDIPGLPAAVPHFATLTPTPAPSPAPESTPTAGNP